MTIRTAGNQAFRQLANVLDLPGTDHLSDIDIGVASPVLDLTTLMQAQLVDRYTLEYDIRSAVGITANDRLLPFDVAGNIAPVLRLWRNGQEFTISDPTALDGKDLLIDHIGFFDEDDDMTAAQVYMSTTTTASRLLLWSGSTAVAGMIVPDGTPVLPFFYFAGDAIDQRLWARVTLAAGGAAITSCTLRLLACEPGVLPYSR